MTAPLPSISVIIPCYNSEKYIADTLRSIIQQSYSPLEILVIDDGSTDGTQKALEPFLDKIKYFKISHSGGPSSPRNLGLKNAVGNLIAFIDSDDLMLPGKLDAAAKVFHTHPGIDFLFTNFQSCDVRGDVIDPDYLSKYKNFRNYFSSTDKNNLSLLNIADTYPCLLRSNFIGTSSTVIRSKIFSAIGVFNESMSNAEDFNLWCRIARANKSFAFLDEVHHSYRIHPSSITQQGSVLFPAIIKECEMNMSFCDQPEIQLILIESIRQLWLGYGYGLRNEGKWEEAIRAYRVALGKKICWPGIKGIILSLLKLRRNDVLSKKS